MPNAQERRAAAASVPYPWPHASARYTNVSRAVRWPGSNPVTLHQPNEKTRTAEGNRALKERLVREGRAHAALVLDGEEAVAWCEYGSCAELPNIYHRKQYDEEADVRPDYRITCLFTDKRYRRRGVSAMALHGAVGLIAAAGGGVVEGYPHDPEGRRVAVLYNGTRAMFEREGFELVRRKGQRNTVMRRTVMPA